MKWKPLPNSSSNVKSRVTENLNFLRIIITMSEVDDILSVANTEAPISCVVSRLTRAGPAAAGWEIEEVFRFLLIVTLLAGQSVGRMTSSDVMTTMYNHQSVICLLGEFLGPSNQLQSCPDEPQTKQTDCISLIHSHLFVCFFTFFLYMGRGANCQKITVRWEVFVCSFSAERKRDKIV